MGVFEDQGDRVVARQCVDQRDEAGLDVVDESRLLAPLAANAEEQSEPLDGSVEVALDAAGLDQEVRDASPVQKRERRFPQLGAGSAADAAIRQLQDVAFAQHGPVDADLAELVDQHAEAVAAPAAQEAVDERGLAAAEEARDEQQRCRGDLVHGRGAYHQSHDRP